MPQKGNRSSLSVAIVRSDGRTKASYKGFGFKNGQSEKGINKDPVNQLALF